MFTTLKISVYATASKAHESSRNILDSQWSALLLTSVVLGKPYTTSVEETPLGHPPDGYNSVGQRRMPVSISIWLIHSYRLYAQRILR